MTVPFSRKNQRTKSTKCWRRCQNQQFIFFDIKNPDSILSYFYNCIKMGGYHKNEYLISFHVHFVSESKLMPVVHLSQL